MKRKIFATCITFVLVSSAFGQNTMIDCAKKYQTIHGFGVNINPQSWNVNPKAVKEVIDSLITDMGCTSFRLMFDDSDWEAVNDNNDPGSYNWAYYDEVYSTPRFTCVWNTIEYLNSKGITDITLSPDGAAPAWIGGTKLYQGAEAEYAEMLASMVFYGIKRRAPALNFTMLSPVNETGCFGLEAPVMTTNQLGTIFTDIATHFINDCISGVTLTGPDDCYNSFNIQALLTSSATMSKLKCFGGHEYGDNTSRSEELIYAVRNSDYPDREVIMSEVNAICYGCDGGEYNSDYGFNNYAGPAYKYVLKHLNVGVTGIQLWEGYDSQYHHPNRSLTWSMWGIFGINDTLRPDVYTKRTHYYVFKQLFNFVRPGFKRIEISTDLSDMTVSAFCDPANGAIVITGKNDNESAQTIEVILKNFPDRSKLMFYYTDATHNFIRGSDVTVTSQLFSKLIPAHCVFTLVSM
jgi:O-glycosyl hydrolase